MTETFFGRMRPIRTDPHKNKNDVLQQILLKVESRVTDMHPDFKMTPQVLNKIIETFKQQNTLLDFLPTNEKHNRLEQFVEEHIDGICVSLKFKEHKKKSMHRDLSVVSFLTNSNARGRVDRIIEPPNNNFYADYLKSIS